VIVPRFGERFTDADGRLWRVRHELRRRGPVAELLVGERPSGEFVDEYDRQWRSLDLSSAAGRARAVLVARESA
jgi:hypothetical protein